ADDRSAQGAVAALKKARAGRLTFLPVKSIRGGRAHQAQALANMEGYRGLAVDCVSFDGRYQNVMEYLLGRVVIVDRLDNAVRMSKQSSSGLRFVTLEGEVINASGAITGGMYKTNTTNLLSRRAEIQQLAEELEGMERKKTDDTERMEKLRTEARHLDDQLSALEQQYRSGQLELLEQEKQLQILTSQMNDLENSGEKREKELSSLREEEAAAQKMISDLKERLADQTRRSTEAEGLLAQWIPQLEQEREQAEYLTEEVTNRRMELNTVQNQRNNVTDTVRRLASSVEDLKAQEEDRLQQIRNLDREKEQLMSGDGGLLKAQEALRREKEEAQLRLIQVQEEKNRIAGELEQREQQTSEMEQQLFSQQQKKYDVEVKLARNETQITGWKDKLWEDFEISYIQAMEFESADFVMSQAQKESREIRGKIKALGDVNVGAIKEYETTKERYEFLTEQRNDLLEAMNSLKTIIDDMDKTIRQNFKESFDQIMVNFEETFQQLFGGGTAQLRLEDEAHPLESGIEIVAQPPGKKLQNINLMSGGEKTMTAIALMFAVLKAKPTPFCILDEVEAALDEANIDRFARYLKNFHDIQFALVTHQKATMEYADVLYGVTMPEQGISKVLSLRMGDDFEL
ncbi:MAG: AAA family ATPase, partial [Firmicutes bacterium]|nr:AAA family ATPase [Bacillota bacterium]